MNKYYKKIKNEDLEIVKKLIKINETINKKLNLLEIEKIKTDFINLDQIHLYLTGYSRTISFEDFKTIKLIIKNKLKAKNIKIYFDIWTRTINIYFKLNTNKKIIKNIKEKNNFYEDAELINIDDRF